MIKTWEDFGNVGRFWDHADGSHIFGQITSWNDGGWLIVDSDFESSRATIKKLNASFGFDGGNGSIDFFGDNVSSKYHIPIQDNAKK